MASGADEKIRRHLLASASVKAETAERCAGDIGAAGEMMSQALSNDGKILLCGNGGSAADCQHLAAEFVSVLNQDFPRRALPAIALTTDTSFLTANANDYGFENVFARQVEGLGRSGDVLIGISTSGNSKNVIRALESARTRGLGTIALTGEAGGEVARVADVAVRVPSSSTQHIQEAHIAVGHLLCALVEDALFAEEDRNR